MSNGYSAVPNIIVGNATITGTLTVTGDGGIRIGSAAPFVRLFKDGAARLALSMNLGTDLATRDVTTQLAHDLAMGEPGYSPRLFEYNPLGTLLSSMLDRTLGINGTLAVNTGNVTENTVGDVLIPGNTLGPHGSLKIEWSLVANVQGGVATTFRVRLGGVQCALFTKSAASNFHMVARLFNRGLTGNQLTSMMVSDNVVGDVELDSLTAVDTTVDQHLTITISSGATTDSWNSYGFQVHAAMQRAASL